MSLARDTVGQFRDDPGHSGTVGKPTIHSSREKSEKKVMGPEGKGWEEDRNSSESGFVKGAHLTKPGWSKYKPILIPNPLIWRYLGIN